jgi:hypothetical protein
MARAVVSGLPQGVLRGMGLFFDAMPEDRDGQGNQVVFSQSLLLV